MNAHMSGQITIQGKLGITDFTFIWFLVAVSAYMIFQATAISKLGSARVTFIRFLTSMNAQMTIPRKHGITCFTFIWFLNSVNASMIIRVTTFSKLGTHVSHLSFSTMSVRV